MNKNVDIKIYQKSTSIVDVVINRKSNFFNQDFNLVLAKLGNKEKLDDLIRGFLDEVEKKYFN